ncbi:aldo/keto reductase [Deltaproteobacteria bacterium]|nr:aldo/keto reductase [Deltaproteobacteria bacterium]
MQYRRFGKLDWKVSALGFGAMRLPIIGKETTNIDELQAIRMIRYAIDHGVNYLDTAYVYHGEKSELVVGKALENGYRDKIKLATKLPSFIVESYVDFDRFLDEQLRRLQTDTIDFYLLHGLDKTFWPRLRDLKIFEWAESALKDGRIKYLGFSFHDEISLFKEIVDSYDNFTFCQIQYNYMDEEYQAGTLGLQYAAAKGLAIVIMEPIRGGQLSRPPEAITRMLDSADQKSTPSELALRWVWSHPEVSVVLSGMSNMEQVVQNVESVSRYGNASLTDKEFVLIKQVRDSFGELIPIPCTECYYCMPCPNGVAIPQIIKLYNEGIMYNDRLGVQALYERSPIAVDEANRPDKCEECGECEEVCPQKLPIIEWLKKTGEYFNQI